MMPNGKMETILKSETVFIGPFKKSSSKSREESQLSCHTYKHVCFTKTLQSAIKELESVQWKAFPGPLLDACGSLSKMWRQTLNFGR